jgi:hypothetical protein
MSEHVVPAPAERRSEYARILNAPDDQTAQGYLFWGPVVAAILIAEALAAFAHVHWPTISSTVGHLENRWTWVAAVVVGIIGAGAYLAIGVGEERKTDRGWIRVRGGDVTPVRYYTALVPIAATIVAGAAAAAAGSEKLVVGYWIYGTLGVTGLVIPSLLVAFKLEVQFPTLFFTVKKLEGRLHWVATVIAAGLAILTVHLALYPWPDITKEPVQYAGLDASHARSKAIGAVAAVRTGKPPLKYSTQARGVDNGNEAWLVFFTATDASGDYGGCVVSVTSAAAKPAPSCGD